MSAFYPNLCRLYLALRGRMPVAVFPHPIRKAGRTIDRALRRSIIRDRRLTVRVRSGLSHGLLIRARLPSEIAYWKGAREPATVRAILRAAKEGSIVYDVGAHIGTVSFGVARLVGDTGRIVAFEPDPDNATSLREGCRLNGLQGRLRVVQAAVWSASSEGIPFRRGSARLSHGGVEADGLGPVRADGGSVSVPATTLDDFIGSGGPSPDLIKIDVEGGESEVLRGGTSLFTVKRPRVIVEVHHPAASREVAEWIERHGYDGEWSVPEQGFPRVLFAWPAGCPPNR